MMNERRHQTRVEWEGRQNRRNNEAQRRAEFWARKVADAEVEPSSPGVLLIRAGLA